MSENIPSYMWATLRVRSVCTFCNVFMWTTKTLIRQCGFAAWSESSFVFVMIRNFNGCILDRQRRKADLILRWAHMSEGAFSHNAALCMSMILTKGITLSNLCNVNHCVSPIMYSQTSMARTSLGPWKFVRNMDSLSHWGLIMTPGQKANADNLGICFSIF